MRATEKKQSQSEADLQPRVDPLLLTSGPGGNPSLPIAQQEDCPPPKVKKPRINWDVGDNAEVMHCAMKDWDNGKGIDENGDELTTNQFANSRGIQPNTFQTYDTANISKRRAIGSQTGMKPKLSTDEQEFIAQVTACYDRANYPRGHKETIDTMQELCPDL
jgi:hypothetical protein